MDLKKKKSYWKYSKDFIQKEKLMNDTAENQIELQCHITLDLLRNTASQYGCRRNF